MRRRSQTGAEDAAATQARLGARPAKFAHVSAREALHRWYEVLPVAASGVTFVITSRGYPLAQLGPLTRQAEASDAGIPPHAMPNA